MFLLMLLVTACVPEESDNGDRLPSFTPGQDSGYTPEPGCMPSQTTYDETVRDLIDSNCGNCHGSAPSFGAGESLTLGYNNLTEGEDGERKIDQMVERLANQTMPPPGTPILHSDLDTLTGWASCGAVHPDQSVGLVASRPVWEPPPSPPPGTKTLDLLAPDTPVPRDALDLYQCFSFDLDIDEPQFIRRIEFVIDESRVLHHIALLRDPDRSAPDGVHPCRDAMPSGSLYLYAWAPGVQPIEFPDGGARAEPGERFVLQIHYNNGAGVENVTDRSGVRLYLGPTVGNEYGMVVPGPLLFDVPANTTRTVQGTCTVVEPMQVIAGAPHMHERGIGFKQTIQRRDGTEEELINITGFAFELQLFYEFPTMLNPGDKIVTRCTYENNLNTTVSGGPGTDDEMCFNFMYVTPPPVERYCDRNDHVAP